MIMSFQVCTSLVPSADEIHDLSQTFYRGVAFPTFARVLLLGNFLSNFTLGFFFFYFLVDSLLLCSVLDTDLVSPGLI